MLDNNESTNNNEDTNNIDINGPLVFSCAGCKTILGDSYSYICSNEKTKTITLSSSSNIQRSANVFTSKTGHDIGSTYFSFSCNICQVVIGKYYLTTSKDLDNIREKFTFNVDLLSTYELGKSKYGKIPEPETLTISFGLDDKTKDQNHDNSDKNINFTEEMLKMKHVIVDLAERVSILENKLSSSLGQPAHAVLRQQSIASMLNVSWYDQNVSDDNFNHTMNNNGINNKRQRF